MKRPAAKRRTVTAENLASLGRARLAEILVEVAATRPDLKRRLRMELAAEHGPSSLAPEIDKRLASLETSRGKITWRQRPAFIRDLDALAGLIADRLAPMDADAAIERLWRMIDTAKGVGARYRARGDELDAVFGRAAQDLGRLLKGVSPHLAATALVESLVKNPLGWKMWLPGLLSETSADMSREALRFLRERSAASPGWVNLVRLLSDAAGDVETYASTFTADARATAPVAAGIARRLLAAGRVDAAGELLRQAADGVRKRAKVDEDWESVWIDYLDLAGREDEAQAVRWASIERTLMPQRARAFIARLADFDDVEAEARAFAIASQFPRFATGLAFLMEWPALPEASGMIEARADEIEVSDEEAELWAAKLRRRYPRAALLLLRKAAAAALRRRDFKASDRLTAEADTIDA